MLRVETKKNFLKILEYVLLLCEKALYKDAQILFDVLQECQEAIISLGEHLEKHVENPDEMIGMMEKLCETFYLLSQDLDHREQYGEEIRCIIEQIMNAVNNMVDTYQIVFFPYKADMWDSMESIWLACKEDIRCECKIVPIPYYHYDAKENSWNYCYEIEKFPSYVPVVNYQEYDLSEKPDAAFIHNPYDEYNYVTRVHEDYFSYNLKKYVKNLFYVPYYVTSGFIAEEHKTLPVYLHADYLVVQSEAFKEGLKDYDFYDKALVLGSPKLDRVIRLCNHKENIPESWKEIIGQKKTLMLNSSLGQFLADSEAYFKKMEYVFDVIKERDDVVLIWRPHPLFRSTIESMRPQFLDVYLNLLKRFEEDKIGILDTTPDIMNTVAIADGYIGETASSVINLFEAAGKPLFILNNYMYRSYTEEEIQRVIIKDCKQVGDVIYCVPMNRGGVLKVTNKDWYHIRFCREIESVPEWRADYMAMESEKDCLYFAPANAAKPLIYNILNNEVKEINVPYKGKPMNLRYMVTYNHKVLFLPSTTKAIAEYDTRRGIWKEYAEPILALQEDVKERIYEDFAGYAVHGKYVWMTTLYSNAVLRFDMENAKYKIWKVGDEQSRYSAIETDGKYVYLAEAVSGNVEVWDLSINTHVSTYFMPAEYKTFLNIQGRGAAFLNLIRVNQMLIGIPCTSNGLVKINLETGGVHLLAAEFFESIMESANGYRIEAHGAVSFAKMLDERRLFLQRRCDGAMLELDVYTEEYHIHHPQYAKVEVSDMLEQKDGFEKRYLHSEFARRESEWFSFEGFLDDLCQNRLGDAMVRQKKEMETMAVNLDGTCGEKVHDFVMGVLTQ